MSVQVGKAVQCNEAKTVVQLLQTPLACSNLLSVCALQLSDIAASCEEYSLEASRLQHKDASEVEQLFLELRDRLRHEAQKTHHY